MLLVRDSAGPLPARAEVQLELVTSEKDWRSYAAQRVAVEAGFGVGEDAARRMVGELRARGDRIALDLYSARDRGQVVGAIGRLRLVPPQQSWARLQEVDVFPAWRGRGYGDALLAAMFALLVTEGSSTVVVGADEDDWPLSWYRRRGFRDVARVPRTR